MAVIGACQVLHREERVEGQSVVYYVWDGTDSPLGALKGYDSQALPTGLRLKVCGFAGLRVCRFAGLGFRVWGFQDG